MAYSRCTDTNDLNVTTVRGEFLCVLRKMPSLELVPSNRRAVPFSESSRSIINEIFIRLTINVAL